eukprot:scpid101045/ scgid6980/ 
MEDLLLDPQVMQGAANIRPPKPRYSQTWPVGAVLSRLRTLGASNCLQLLTLSQKTVMLIALAKAPRVSDMEGLDTAFMKQCPDGEEFTLANPSKAQRAGTAPSRFFLPSHAEDGLVCPVKALVGIHCRCPAVSYITGTVSLVLVDSLPASTGFLLHHCPVADYASHR